MSSEPSLARRAANQYLAFFSFTARRIVAPLFVLGGGITAVVNIPALLPGRTVMVNGAPSDDLVLRAASVVFPLLVAALGVAMYRASPVRLPEARNE
jgi:hypothetical protein